MAVRFIIYFNSPTSYTQFSHNYADLSTYYVSTLLLLVPFLQFCYSKINLLQQVMKGDNFSRFCTNIQDNNNQSRMIVRKIVAWPTSALRQFRSVGRSIYTMTQITNELSFTQKFYSAIEQKLASKTPNSFLRLQINSGEGCEGFTYKFKFDESLNESKDFIKTQTLITNQGKQKQRVIFAVNAQEIKLLKGATIDFAEEMMREIFYVKENPNAEIQCSCKVSFSPKQGVL